MFLLKQSRSRVLGLLAFWRLDQDDFVGFNITVNRAQTVSSIESRGGLLDNEEARGTGSGL